MPLPLLLAVDEDRDALEDVETYLVRRYGRERQGALAGGGRGELLDLATAAHAQIGHVEPFDADALFGQALARRAATCPRRSRDFRTS